MPAAVFRKLKEMEAAKSKSKMYFWKLLEPVIKREDEIAHVKLQCHMRLCTAERAAMTLDLFKERMMVAEFDNGH